MSKDTTLCEVIDIVGIDKEDFKKENINLMFGPVSHIQYCVEMMNFPNIETIDGMITKKLRERRNNAE